MYTHIAASAFQCYSCDSENSYDSDNCRFGRLDRRHITTCPNGVYACFIQTIARSDLNFNIIRRGCATTPNACVPAFPNFNNGGGFQQQGGFIQGNQGHSESCASTLCEGDLCNSSPKVISSFIILIASFVVSRFF